MILRMKREEGKTNRTIAKSVGVSSSTVHDCLQRALCSSLPWPLPESLDDEHLERLLYPHSSQLAVKQGCEVDWSLIHKELKRKGVTLQLLWLEYKEQKTHGYGYSQFCNLYRSYRQGLDVWMRQTHKIGEKAFIDYAGMTVNIGMNTTTGETAKAYIFVMVLGASGYTYAEATLSQTLPDWIASHKNAFEFFRGVPELLIPDNLKSGVQQAHRYDPDANPTYHEFAAHYGTAIMPARVRSPQDKAKAEQMVKQIEQQILAAMRNEIFFSVLEFNQSLWKRLEALNAHPFQKLPGSRTTLFQELEQSALKVLPLYPYDYADWKILKVDGSYHVDIDGHYYSVPYSLSKKKIEIRYTAHIVQCFYKGKQVALHPRRHEKGGCTTLNEHRPKSHRAYAMETPERLFARAEAVGGSTKALVDSIFAAREHPHIALRVSSGILRLAKRYSETRLDAACQRALRIGATTYQSIESILKHGLDREPLPDMISEETPRVTQAPHDNLRNHHYYLPIH